jgi:hypothetical protein
VSDDACVVGPSVLSQNECNVMYSERVKGQNRM